jgi:hypothetical protein
MTKLMGLAKYSTNVNILRITCIQYSKNLSVPNLILSNIILVTIGLLLYVIFLHAKNYFILITILPNMNSYYSKIVLLLIHLA